MIPRYFGKPPELYESPRCLGMSHATARLYDFLFWLSHRHSSLQFDVLDEEITTLADLSKGTLAYARKDLSKRGLIVCRRLPRGYTYVLCDAKTGEPYPGGPKVKTPYKAKSSSPSKSEQPTAGVPEVVKVEAPKPVTTTPQRAPNVLPMRADGRPDYGFDKLFKSS